MSNLRRDGVVLKYSSLPTGSDFGAPFNLGECLSVGLAGLGLCVCTYALLLYCDMYIHMCEFGNIARAILAPKRVSVCSHSHVKWE